MAVAVRLEIFAELSARIAAGEPRAEVLASASVTEAQFETSQAFWLGRLSGQAGPRRDMLARHYGELFAEAQRRLSAPKRPSLRPWRLAAPAKLAFVVPSTPVRGESWVVPDVSSRSAAPYAPRLTLEQLAAFRAELALAADSERVAVLERFGLDAATWEKEDSHWRGALAGDESLFQRYLRHFQYCKALHEPRG